MYNITARQVKMEPIMRIGLVFHKDPLVPASGIDLIRLKALSLGLTDLGAQVTIIAPVAIPGLLGEKVPVVPLSTLDDRQGYDLVKTCYHYSLELLANYSGPLVCRLVRVVDEHLPDRDVLQRPRLLASQRLAAERATGMIFNNRENMSRWREIYGNRQKIAIIPTGCPTDLPSLGPNPYDGKLPVLLFLGSLAAPRMVELINHAAERLRGRMAVHVVGKNKTELYGGSTRLLSPLVTDHGQMPEEATWDYLHYARVGLALAAGPDPFDNDLSKIMAYLRSGLAILCEERVVNAGLAMKYGVGQVFRYGNAGDLVEKALSLATGNIRVPDPDSMPRLIRLNSWSRRAEVLYRFLQFLLR